MALALPYVGYNFWDASRSGSVSNPIIWPSLLLTPLVYVFGMIWLSPFPWQMGRGNEARWVLGIRIISMAEAYMIGMVLMDAWFQYLAGRPTSIRMIIPFHIIFHAPSMMLVGYVLAAGERLGAVNEDLMAQAREAQVRVLQGQLHPHVLFNALNGLAELIHKDQDEAEASVRHLSDLLRKVLRATDDPDYSLGEERNLLEDYLHMEGLRLGKRMRLSWDWDSAVDELRIPPLFLQPLVENAIKHGVGPSRKGGEVIIHARREGLLAVMGVRNSGEPLTPGVEDKTSVGLSNLRSRLELVFGGAAHFSIRSEGEWTVAEIRLPWVALQDSERVYECVESGRGGGRVSGSGAFIALP